MNSKTFLMSFDNVLSHDQCDSLVEWHRYDDVAKTVKATRESRRDEQKWLPKDSPLWIPLQNAKRSMLEAYMERFP